MFECSEVRSPALPGNWLSQRQAQALLNVPDISTVRGLHDARRTAVRNMRRMFAAQGNRLKKTPIAASGNTRQS
jgi:hypothetical protein